MTITSSGPKCDVCGHHILGLTEDDTMSQFKVPGIARTLHCHDRKCRASVEEMVKTQDWKGLPEGPLRAAFQEADTEETTTN